MPHFTDGTTWLNEPPFWTVEGADLVVRSGAETDFWQSTFYGFRRDNGHFLHRDWDGELTAETRFTGAYETVYDQAGLMLRTDAEHWIKCGIEYTDGARHSSVVVTGGNSDWSVQRLTSTTAPIGVRLTRLADACTVQFQTGYADWHMARLAWFPPARHRVLVGPTFCSPEREGFEAGFDDFRVGPPVSREIH